MTWHEKLERISWARDSVNGAARALSAMAETEALGGALEQIGTDLDALAERLHGRIEARDDLEKRALEREYLKEAMG